MQPTFWIKTTAVALAVTGVAVIVISAPALLAFIVPNGFPFANNGINAVLGMWAVCSIVAGIYAFKIFRGLYRLERPAYVNAFLLLGLFILYLPARYVAFAYGYTLGGRVLDSTYYYYQYSDLLGSIIPSVAVALIALIAACILYTQKTSFLPAAYTLIDWAFIPFSSITIAIASYFVATMMIVPFLFPQSVFHKDGYISCMQDSDCVNFSGPGADQFSPYTKVCKEVSGFDPQRNNEYAQRAGKFCQYERIYYYGDEKNGVQLSVTASARKNPIGEARVSDPNDLWWTVFAKTTGERYWSYPIYISIQRPDGLTELHSIDAACPGVAANRSLGNGNGVSEVGNFYLRHAVGGVEVVKQWFPQVGKYQVVWTIGGASSKPFEVEVLPN